MAFNVTAQDVRQLAEMAEDRIRTLTLCKTYADLYPAIQPFVDRGGREAIKDAVSFLIEKGVFSEQQRINAEKAFRSIRKRLAESETV